MTRQLTDYFRESKRVKAQLRKRGLNAEEQLYVLGNLIGALIAAHGRSLDDRIGTCERIEKLIREAATIGGETDQGLH